MDHPRTLIEVSQPTNNVGIMSDNQDDQRILQALKDNPGLKACVLEMLDITKDTTNQLDRGDDAEDAVVEVIQKTGAVLLKEWAQSKADKARQIAEAEPGNRMHEKKRCCGIHQ
jgi:hypothetical protein